MEVGDLVRVDLPGYSELHGQLCVITKLFFDNPWQQDRLAAYLFFMDGQENPIYVSDLEVINESR